MALDQIKDEEEEGGMSFLDHLEALRWHLLRSVSAVLIFTVAAFIAKDFVFGVLILGPSKVDFWTYRVLCDLGNYAGIPALCINDLPFTIQNEGSYTLSLVSTNAAGCVDSSSGVITVISGLLEVSIPNSFTPNGDGYNDLFKPVLKGLEEMNLIIFNRYGSQVASWKEGLINWDGSHSGAQSPDGVYFYVLQGKDYSGTDIERAGSITIVR